MFHVVADHAAEGLVDEVPPVPGVVGAEQHPVDPEVLEGQGPVDDLERAGHCQGPLGLLERLAEGAARGDGRSQAQREP